MASEKEFELLDQYVGNRLSTADKAAFEEKLAADADLKNELAFQQKIVDGIRKARASELKKMLNDIPMSSIPTEGNSLLTQVGIWVAAAGLVGTGLYFYLKPGEQTTIQTPVADQVTEVEKQTEAEPLTVQPESSDAEATEQAPEVTNTESESKAPVASNTPKVTKPKAETTTKEATRKEEAVTKPVAPATLDVFDPTEDLATSGKKDESGVVEEKEPAKAPSIVVETASDKRYDFHYQFKNEKLYLYGAFEKNLYEIMEFFSDNKRTMFLYYKDNYYLLNEENDKVKPLTPITDAALLQKLKDYRGN